MKPFLTLLLESFRGLKSQLIFWITLGLTILFAVIFLSLGFDENGASIFFGAASFGGEELAKGSLGSRIMYFLAFDQLISGVWLSWIAIILALISCAPIFPNTMTEGGAAMVMTKGVSRLQVFLAKVLGSLFFAGIQVSVFVLIVLIAFKWRLGEWSFSLLWYIPAVLLVFTGLYSFLVLVAVKTRSVLTAILLTMLVWGISAGLGVVERFFDLQVTQAEMSQKYADDDAPVSVETSVNEDLPDTSEIENEPADHSSEVSPQTTDKSLAESKKWHRIVTMIHTPFPKNGPVMASASRKLFDEQAENAMSGMGRDPSNSEGMKEFNEDVKGFFNRNSSFYSIWSSLIFALVMFTLAGWLFYRKDY